MKKAILFGLTVILVFSGVFGGLMVGLKPEAEEQKEAPPEKLDDYPVRIHIVLTTEASAMEKDYSSYFSKLGIQDLVWVEEIEYRDGVAFSVVNEYWEAKKISQEAADKVWEDNQNSEKPIFVHPENYHRYYVLYLEEQTEEEIQQLISDLKKMEIVYEAECGVFAYLPIE